jgi:hypothetical protein
MLDSESKEVEPVSPRLVLIVLRLCDYRYTILASIATSSASGSEDSEDAKGQSAKLADENKDDEDK